MKIVPLILLLILAIVNVQAQTGYAIIRGKVNTLKDKDSVVLTVNKFGYPFIEVNEIKIQPIINHKFVLKIPINNYPINVSITYKERIENDSHYVKLYNLSLENYYLESGDDIVISENNKVYTFTRKNAERFRIISALNKIEKKINTGLSWDDPNNTKLYFERQDKLLVEKSQFIDSKRAIISHNVYILLKADVLGNYLSRWSFLNLMPKALIDAAKSNLDTYHSTVPGKYLNTTTFNKHDILKFSSAYSDGLLIKYQFDSCTNSRRPYTLQKSFDYFTHHFSGGLKERLVTNEIYGHKDSNEDLMPYVSQSLDFISYSDFRDIIQNLKLTRLPGAPAFNFTLSDTSGRMRSFSEFKGKVVVLDFWFTGCGSCRLSAPFLEKVELYFKEKPVVFLTINLDRKREIWINTVKEKTYTSNFGTDLFTNGEAFSSPISKYYNIDGCPTFILIDKTGKLTINPENPRFDDGLQLTTLIENELLK